MRSVIAGRRFEAYFRLATIALQLRGDLGESARRLAGSVSLRNRDFRFARQFRPLGQPECAQDAGQLVRRSHGRHLAELVSKFAAGESRCSAASRVATRSSIWGRNLAHSRFSASFSSGCGYVLRHRRRP